MDLHLQVIPCCLLVLLTGAVSQSIIYQFVSTCAVSGSSVTLPCTFTPQNSIMIDNGQMMVPLEVKHVIWCRNHTVCQGTTPRVYDSSASGDSRFQYLGDKQSSCTLRINNIQMRDKETYRFRMETNNRKGHFTNQTGVKVDVIETPKQMQISSSSNETEVEAGRTVTLECTSTCTFNHLNVSWRRDDHTLSEASPTFLLGPLTAKDSGNYTCSLEGRTGTMSRPLRLTVQVENSGVHLPLVVGVVCGVLLTVVALTALFCVITSRRKRAAAEAARGVEGGAERGLEELSSSLSSNQQPAGNNQEVEDVSYAAVQFKHQQARRVEVDEDAVIYSSVVSRG